MKRKHQKKVYGTESEGKKYVQERKHDHIEVVFFPYKASMADSFETIYLAAKEDPLCTAVWCPIPYYDKNPDGTYRKVNYEGDDYSDKFKVTKWYEYDVESRHPDIIFIHYPYDGSNYVTSVHPDYYSSRLKDCTDLLVYVDYGVPIWMPNDPSVFAGYKEEQVLPAHLHSGLIVTYSQALADYIKHLLLFSVQTSEQRIEDLQGRIIALGSSKFDCVLRAQREDPILPQEWKCKIGDRKVLLLNTSLAELLENNEAHMADIEEFVDTVSSHNDIVLWWRPHPLTESTIKSMRPKLLNQYLSIRKESERTGIVDETDDLYRAIACSDGLISTESSMVYLYLATGKPFTMMTRRKLHSDWRVDEGEDFKEPLRTRLAHMRAHKGANPGNWNGCIWWDNFQPEDLIGRVHYGNFMERFIHYIVHMDEYPEADEYRKLSLQMFRDFVVNPDGTAGEHIYQYCKERVMA